MNAKLIIRNTPPNFYHLAALAAKDFALQSENDRGVLTFKDGPAFWIKRTATGNISVSGEKPR